MEFDLQWLLVGLPLTFAFGWIASRFDVKQWQREHRESPRAYYTGLNLLLNEQQDKAIDAFIEAVRQDPDTSDLHFALGNLFRRRGEYERAVRVHQHLLDRADLDRGDRERAQHALALDFMKAGLFDRAEAAYRALEGTPFDTDSRLALLSLYERSRDWRAAAEVAAQLEKSGAGSFASRIAHHWCEIALEADAKQQAAEVQDALKKAREASPQSPRPRMLAAQILAREGNHRAAFDLHSELLALSPGSFTLVAREYAVSAQACGEAVTARQRLQTLYERMPSLDLLRALDVLDNDAAQRQQRLAAHLQVQPTLSTAYEVLKASGNGAQDAATSKALADAVGRAAKPLQRYRCAACGFEVQHYFWQCPGCLTWDSYPAQRLEDL